MKIFNKSQIFLLIYCIAIPAQLFHLENNFTQADSLRGMLSQQRTCYDITFYHLDLEVNPQNKFISGKNRIEFKVIFPFDVLQIDLFKNMEIEKILFKNRPLKFTREFNAVFVYFPTKLVKEQKGSITVYFSGNPQVAKNPPWDGGFIWEKDSSGNPWVAVTCQGTGASLWWPNKDHQADEPDSVLLSVKVPPGLMDVSNGRLRTVKKLKNGWIQYDWFISYPINNYNLTLNIGKFSHFSESFIGNTTLTLDYYVLPENLEKAKKQFKQVKPMLACFEKYFGPYPFPRDGFKLIESPHLGMEHQSAIAYGNKYKNGYNGSSATSAGLKFDFIIIHESAHEWWGNVITSRDLADLWIHESFAAYAEALYVEYRWGYDASMSYLEGKKQDVRNDKSIIGPPNVNQEGSGDMYPKGALMLNTLRHIINNDALWFSILKEIVANFKYKTIDANDIFDFINTKSGKNFDKFFDQYLKNKDIPQLDIILEKKGKTLTCSYRWKSDISNYDMPVKVTIAPNKFDFIFPTSSLQKIQLHEMDPNDFQVAEKQFYVNVNLRKIYKL